MPKTASGRKVKLLSWNWGVHFRLRMAFVGFNWWWIGNCLDLFILPLPCVVVHLWWAWHDPEQ